MSSQAILAALRAIKINGTIAVGLEGATEKGLESELYTKVPYPGISEEANYEVLPSRLRLYQSDGTNKDMPRAQDFREMSEEQIHQIVTLNYAAAMDSDIFGGGAATDRMIAIYVAAKLCHAVNGWVGDSPFQEIRLCPVPSELVEADFLRSVHQHMQEAVLLIASAALTYYTSNHHMGGAKASGLILKTCKQLDIPIKKRDNSQDDLIYRQVYAIVHSPDKRVILYCMLPANRHNTMRVSVDWPCPPALLVDTFVGARVSSMPAGTHKFALTHEILEAMASYGVLPLMPELDRLPQFYELRSRVLDGGFAAHIGAAYLTNGSSIPVIPSYQNLPDVTSLFTICSIFAVIVMPTSTLSQAPAVLARAEEAASLHPAWKATCDSIASSKLVKAHKMVAQVLSSGLAVTGHVEKLFNVLEAQSGPQEEKDIAIKRAGQMMKEESRYLLDAAKNPGTPHESQLARVAASADALGELFRR